MPHDLGARSFRMDDYLTSRADSTILLGIVFMAWGVVFLAILVTRVLI